MRPMLATPGTPPQRGDWLHEVKWDGMRVLADISDHRLTLWARSGREITSTFPELGPIADTLKDAMLDGEIIAIADGVPSFAALAERMHVTDHVRALELAEAIPVTVMSFDLLRLYGVELLDRPLEQRRASLDRLELPPAGWRHSPTYADGPALFSATKEQGLEGVVAKRLGSRYFPGRRSPDWIKTPHRLHQACVVGGWRREQGSSSKVGALLLGIPDDAGRLRFAGRVGSGISNRASQELLASLVPCPDSPFDGDLPALDTSAAIWCKPTVVVEVRHMGHTSGGRLRHPVYRGIRADLTPEGVTRES